MKQIEEFLERLKGGESNFTRVHYEYDEYDCEISNICKKFYRNNDVHNAIINFWNKKQENSYFELKHPIYNNIITRATFSISVSEVNYIFFADVEQNYIWCLFQSNDIFNKMIIGNKIFTLIDDWVDIDFVVFKNIKSDNLKYKNIDFGFVLPNMVSMWHFFYERLVGIYMIKLSKCVKDTPTLFFPNFCNKTKKDMVFFMPNFYKGAFFSNKLSHNNHPKFLSYIDDIYNESMLQKKYYEKHELTLWFGLVCRETEKTWIEQISGYINIIKYFHIFFKDIKIFIDGMKVNENQNNKVFTNHFTELADKFFNKIYYSIKNLEGIKIELINKVSMREAIRICSDIDLAIVEAGSAAIIPHIICKKPAVFYGNIYYINGIISFYKDYSRSNYEIIDSKYSKLSYRNNHMLNVWEGYHNYHIPWEHLFNKAIYLLNKMMKRNFYELIVPDVELVAKQYELQQELGIEISLENIALYCSIQKQINTLNFNNNIQSISENKYSCDGDKINRFNTAKFRIQNQLSYKLGQAMIANSKSFLGYIRMPFVLSYIKDKHKQEQKIYQEKIKKDPSLKLPTLEQYPDYKEALKEKECFTYKLGQALIQANKTWYKGGYIKLWFNVKNLKKEFRKK